MIKIVENYSNNSSCKRTLPNILIDKTYLIVALRMIVLVPTVDAGWPKKEYVSKLNHFVLGIYD